MRRRKELNEAKLAKKQAEIEDELVNLDIEQVVEQEKQADEAQEKMEQEKLAQTEQAAAATGGLGAIAGLGGNPNIMNAILGASSAVNGLLGDVKNNFLDIAKQDEDKRKNESKKQINKITDEIDIELEKSKLLNQISAVDGALAAGIEEDAQK